MLELEKKLREASKAYYTNGSSAMSDAEYDMNLELLKTVDPQNDFLKEIGSDLVFSSDNSKWVKEKHEYPVGSLNKVQTLEEFKKWYSKLNNKDIIVEEKLDGISIVATYENGRLISALTRGSGIEGEVITRNFIKMKNVKKIINFKDKIVVRGEIILKRSDFDKLPEEEDFKNLRNACAGIAKRLDGKYCEYLTFMPHGILNHQDLKLKTELEVLNVIESLFTNFVTYIIDDPKSTLDKVSFVESVYNDYINDDRDKLDYDIDGLVIKQNILEDDDWKNPEYQIAFKFPHQAKTSYIKDIEISTRGGHICPVAIIDPVEIAGVTVSRVGLNNFKFCQDRNIGIGAKVQVTRRNDVIPYIEEVLVKGKDIQIPTHCPVCNSPLELESDESLYYTCSNIDCKCKLIRHIMKWMTAHNSKGIAAATIELLIDNNIINSFEDFITLSYNKHSWNNILNIQGFGESKLNTLISEIEKTSNTTWINFLVGIDISYIGKSMLEKILDKIPKLDDISDFEKFIYSPEIYKVDGFANENVIRLRSGFDKNKKKINTLIKSGVKIEKFVNDKVDSSLQFLSGISFCFTGSLETMGRTEAEKLVKKYGGDIKGVSKKLTYLVTNDVNSGSSKNEKARELGVKVIDEVKFLEILRIN